MIYKFGKIEINTDIREILASGEAQKVQPKVYDLLIFLIENRDRAVGKEEIQDRIWPDVEVTETALTRAVMKARKLLQADGDAIKTVHGHGYHFVGDLLPTDPSKTQTTTSPAPKITQPKFAVLALVVLLAIITTGLLYWRDEPQAHDVSLAFLPVIDRTSDAKFAWTSLGLMSLGTQMVKAENSVNTISNRETAKLDPETLPDDLQLDASTLESLQSEFKANHLVLCRLSKTDQFELSYTVYHPKGQTPPVTITGDNPTAMMQQLTKNLIATLPGNPGTPKYKAISDDVFTNELYSRGMHHQMRGDADKAKEYFSLVKQEDPLLFWPRYELALTTRKLGDAAASETELLELLAELPKFNAEPTAIIAVYSGLGLARQILNDEDQAITYIKQAFDEATRLERPDYQKLLSGNIALSYKRKQDYKESRRWLSRSKQIAIDNNIPLTGQITYQLAQLERNEGNNEKALALFDEAQQMYAANDFQRHVASAMSSKGQIHTRMGQWAKAHAEQDKALALKIELNNPLGVLDSRINIINTLIKEGRFSAAETALDQIWPLLDNESKATRRKYFERAEVALAFARGEHQKAIDLGHAMASKHLDATTGVLVLKAMYLTGDTAPLIERLAQYGDPNDGINMRRQLTYWDLKCFASQQTNDPSQMDDLKQYIALTRRMGLYASMGDGLLQLGQLQLRASQQSDMQNTLAELKQHQLTWWQVTLFEAEVALSQGDTVRAKELATQAKNQATEAWGSTEQERHDVIMAS